MNCNISDHRFIDLVDIGQLRSLLEFHSRISGMGCFLLDNNGDNLVSIGCQEIYSRFHRIHPVCSKQCQECDVQIKIHSINNADNYIEFRCINGMIDIAMPVFIGGHHLVTLITGQFFIDDDPPDREFIFNQALKYGFDPTEYLGTLDQTPVFSRNHVRSNLIYLHSLIKQLSESSLKSIRTANELKKHTPVTRERLVSTLLNNIPDFIARFDTKGRIIFVNRAVTTCFGVPLDKFVGNTQLFLESSPNDGFHRLHEAILQAVTQGEANSIETMLRTPEGYRYFEARHIPEKDDNGVVQSVLGIARDITDRKQMENKLIDSEEKFRDNSKLLSSILESSIDVSIYALDQQYRYLAYNRRHKELMKRIWGEDIAVGMSLLDLITSENREKIHTRFDKVLSGCSVYEEDRIIIKKDNQERYEYLEYHGSPILNSNGKVTGLTIYTVNITERKQIEEKLHKQELQLRTLAEVFPGVLCYFCMNSDGVFYMPYASHGIQELCGLSHDSLKNDMSALFNMVHPDDYERNMDSLLISAQTLSPWYSEFRLLHPDKGYVWIEGNATPERELNGGRIWYGFYHDITDRKLNEEALNAKRLQLAELASDLALAEERERQNIAAMLHDHIGQTLLLGRIKLGTIADEKMTTTQQKVVVEVKELLDQVSQNIHKLTVQLSPPILATAGLEAALEWLGRRIEEDYDLFVEFDDDTQVKPLSDEARSVVYQCARELLINVAKHAKADHARVAVSLESNRYKLTVEDDGIGFNSAMLGHDPSKAGRFGLLSIQIRMERLGGGVVYDSKPGSGCRMTLFAPLANTNN